MVAITRCHKFDGNDYLNNFYSKETKLFSVQNLDNQLNNEKQNKKDEDTKITGNILELIILRDSWILFTVCSKTFTSRLHWLFL